MQKNKYLDDLGFKQDEYSTNFIEDDDPRSEEWLMQHEQYGFDSGECWNMDRAFVEWLYSHLMMFKEESQKECVDLSFHKF